ncbi:type II/IV secretion system protein [Candidatus Wolfebacteria bacterium]|nr:type II/IV secretion system protein [Candidatus Wolfebacteria bacterium]
MLATPGKEGILKELSRPIDEISIIDLVDSILAYANDARTSDIHIDPSEKNVAIRFRIDGVMNEAFEVPNDIHSEIVSRIKVLSGLRTDEHQIAQDGRFKFQTPDKKTRFDVRVSIVPTYYGENAILRLLSDQGQTMSLKNIGLSERDYLKVEHSIHKPYGMILATGPTGSGKTTTLYTILHELNTPDVSIITIEDPIEYSLEGIDQIQVNNQTGLTFANGLRAILRQDPNVIMVGEIRDEETASISVNAALTGHLLLSTIHTNDAPTTLPRLLDMKIESFLIASTVNIAIGQRLVRRICPHCKEKKEYSLAAIEALRAEIPAKLLEGENSFYVGVGCGECNKSGYRGRIGIYEVLEVTDAIREAIVNHMGAGEIKKLAIHEGMTTMLEDGFRKVKEGVTTIEEIIRVVHE